METPRFQLADSETGAPLLALRRLLSDKSARSKEPG